MIRPNPDSTDPEQALLALLLPLLPEADAVRVAEELAPRYADLANGYEDGYADGENETWLSVRQILSYAGPDAEKVDDLWKMANS